jgi:hypothetical protein
VADMDSNASKGALLLTEGGPLYRIQKRLKLIREREPRLLKVAGLSIFVTWVPLLFLSAAQGTAFRTATVTVPFLHDFATYTRFLVGVPILILAESILGPRLAAAASFFVTSGLVLEKDYARFDAAVERGLRLRDSIVAELILVIGGYAFALTGLKAFAVHVATWSSTHTEMGFSLTWAGWWLIGFCAPFFNFLMLRWIWRLFLWAQFLGTMNSLDLQLFPPHPDESGGLGFIGRAQQFFGIVLFGYSAATAGVLADSVIYDKVPLQHYAAPIAAYVVVVVGIVIAPLLVFALRLHETKIKGLYQYGSLATSYTSAFHHKWITKSQEESEPLLGTSDIQSLADLGNSFGFIKSMDDLPMNPRTPIHLALACLIPMSPLLLIVIPLKDILKLIFKAVL